MILTKNKAVLDEMPQDRREENKHIGFCLNPGNKGFWESVQSKIYVDKTGLIACTNGSINKK